MSLINITIWLQRCCINYSWYRSVCHIISATLSKSKRYINLSTVFQGLRYYLANDQMKKFTAFMLVMNMNILFGQQFDSFEIESLFLKKLNENKLHDFSELQLSLMVERFEDKLEVINMFYGEFYALQEQFDQAKVSLSKIPRSSIHYPRAILKRIDITHDVGGKKEAYVDYFKSAPEIPVSTELVNAHRNAILTYSKLLSDEGQINKALEILKLLDQLPPDDAADDREYTLIKCRMFLNSMSAVADRGNSIRAYKKQIETTINHLETLVWKLDGTAAIAYAELAHAYNLLDRPENAVDILKTGGDFLFKVEQAMKKKGEDVTRSPLRLANFYLAEAF